jgi:hypothetical protein
MMFLRHLYPVIELAHTARVHPGKCSNQNQPPTTVNHYAEPLLTPPMGGIP